MKLKIKSPTTEELQQELDINLIDLLGDVFLLECVCYCSQMDMRVSPCFTDEVTREAVNRLHSYIKQHTDEVCSLCNILTRFL